MSQQHFVVLLEVGYNLVKWQSPQNVNRLHFLAPRNDRKPWQAQLAPMFAIYLKLHLILCVRSYHTVIMFYNICREVHLYMMHLCPAIQQRHIKFTVQTKPYPPQISLDMATSLQRAELATCKLQPAPPRQRRSRHQWKVSAQAARSAHFPYSSHCNET